MLSNNDGCIVARSAKARPRHCDGNPYFKARQELNARTWCAQLELRPVRRHEPADDSLWKFTAKSSRLFLDEAFGRVRRPKDGDL